MINLIDNFYEKNNLGLVTINFINLHFNESFQSQSNYYGGDRLLAYPTYETANFKKSDFLYDVLKNTLEEKIKIKPLNIETFLRKTKLSECKKSPSWKQYKPHQDSEFFDLAGLIYFNSNHLKDGTFIFNSEQDFEPTVIVGSKYNRCVIYSTDVWHSPSMEQNVEERWTQPFFIIYKEKTYKKYLNNKNET